MNSPMIPQKFPTQPRKLCKPYEFDPRSEHQPFVLWVS